VVELSGTWRAAPIDDDLLRRFVDPDFDDSAWQEMEVPSHWRSHPAFASHDEPLLYRTAFATAAALAGPTPATAAGPGHHWEADERRCWLTFDGTFYSTDVWLDGDYLGDTEGYFFPHTLEVTEQMRLRDEHCLAVSVTSTPPADRTAKQAITGVFQHWDCLDPDWNPGGIWRPVHLDTTGPVRIRHARALCRAADERTASVQLRTVLDTDEARTVAITTTLGDQQTTAQRTLAAGENRVEWTLTVPRPELWWPRALGDPALHDLAVEVHCDDRVSDLRSWRIGLRSVQLRNWILRINGERLFVKGSNLGPTRMALAEATPDELGRDVTLAQQAGLDMVRIHGHVTRPELYDAADEAGLLVWQDFPLQWGHARGIRAQARRQAREMVDLLGHHPSVAVWCGHNQPLALDIDAKTIADPSRMRSAAVRGAVAMVLPTWNKTVLDGAVRRVLGRSDPSRPVVAHSGVLPHPPRFDGTDSHLYFGWYHGRHEQLAGVLRLWPRLGRFVSEFGAQAVPADADFLEPGRWPDLDWERLAHRHNLQKARFDRYVAPQDFATFEEWRDATQCYQAELVRRHIETLRRLKYRPTGGFLQFCLADAHPAVTWSVLDHRRRPKAGFDALTAACAPVVVVADPLPTTLTAGTAVALDVHVVSDLRTPLPDAVVDARLTWPGGTHAWRWSGDVPADACVRVGTMQFMTPPVEGGDHAGDHTVEVALSLQADGTTAHNRYEAALV
jgi:beta-mannosidase